MKLTNAIAEFEHTKVEDVEYGNLFVFDGTPFLVCNDRRGGRSAKLIDKLRAYSPAVRVLCVDVMDGRACYLRYGTLGREMRADVTIVPLGSPDVCKAESDNETNEGGERGNIIGAPFPGQVLCEVQGEGKE